MLATETHTVGKRAVHIPLERCLVLILFPFAFATSSVDIITSLFFANVGQGKPKNFYPSSLGMPKLNILSLYGAEKLFGTTESTKLGRETDKDVKGFSISKMYFIGIK